MAFLLLQRVNLITTLFYDLLRRAFEGAIQQQRNDYNVI